MSIKARVFHWYVLFLVSLMFSSDSTAQNASVNGSWDLRANLTVHTSRRKVILNPAVQHIPLDPSKAHLRPPPPRIPDVFNTFVGLSVFRDGYRCAKTVLTCFQRAKHPERLYFGIVDQVNADDLKCIDEYCKLAAAMWPDRGACPYRDQIRVDERVASESRGPTLARHYQQELVRDEEFCLQLDAHSIFTNNWDHFLLAEWERIGNEMAVLTTYLHNTEGNFVQPNGDNRHPRSLPHLCTTKRGNNGCVRTVGASSIIGSKFPQMSALWGAGLSFSKCHAERRVRIDSHTLWMFDGEEFLRSSHLWTHGYDLYSPSLLGSVVYHNYSKVPARFERITVDPAVRKDEREMGINRFHLIVGKPFKGNVDTFEMDKYAFGNVRPFAAYLNFSGVTFEEDKEDRDSCEQLHWVPYYDPTEVEKIVGGGWKMDPFAGHKVEAVQVTKKPAPPLESEELREDDKEPPALRNVESVAIDRKLRPVQAHDASIKATRLSLIWMPAFLAVATVLLLLMRTTRRSRLKHQMKHKLPSDNE